MASASGIVLPAQGDSTRFGSKIPADVNFLIKSHTERLLHLVEDSRVRLEADVAEKLHQALGSAGLVEGDSPHSRRGDSHGIRPPPTTPAPFEYTFCTAGHRGAQNLDNLNARERRADSKDTSLSRASPGIPGLRLNRRLEVDAFGRDVSGDESVEKTSAIGKEKIRKTMPMFADPMAMKEKIREAISSKDYSVTSYYHEEGWCQFIAKNQAFENSTLLIIFLNAIWIAIDTDLNQEALLIDAPWPFIVIENLFCCFFFFEWGVRFLAFKRKRNCLKDAWFVFDTVLVCLMVVETWVLSIAFGLVLDGSGNRKLGNTGVLKMVRLCRLTRMGRLARLLRAVPELIILIKGLAEASRSVFFTLVLLVVLIYLFAIVFTQVIDQLADPDDYPSLKEEYFSSVGHSMATLLLEGVIPDMARIVRHCSGEHFLLGALVLGFILLATLTVMNMLIGVLCEVVGVVAAVEKEELAVNYVKAKLLAVFAEEEVLCENFMINKGKFERLLMEPNAVRVIQEIGVDVIGLVDFSDYIFPDGNEELAFPMFMELMLQLRGTNNSTVKDIVDLRRYMLREFHRVNDTVTHAESTIRRAAEYLRDSRSSTPCSCSPQGVASQAAACDGGVTAGGSLATAPAAASNEDIPPQYGPRVGVRGSAATKEALDGADAAWRLPLPPLATSTAPSAQKQRRQGTRRASPTWLPGDALARARQVPPSATEDPLSARLPTPEGVELEPRALSCAPSRANGVGGDGTHSQEVTKVTFPGRAMPAHLPHPTSPTANADGETDNPEKAVEVQAA